jgi:hypothetical protein
LLVDERMRVERSARRDEQHVVGADGRADGEKTVSAGAILETTGCLPHRRCAQHKRGDKDKRDAECETLHAEQMAHMRRSKAAHLSMSGSLPSLGGKARFCDRRHMTNGAPALLSTSSGQSSPAVNRWDQISGLN